MDYGQYAKEAHCLESAVEDVTRRCEAHFADATPTPEMVAQWLTETLRPAAAHLFAQTPTTPWEKLGIPRELWDSLSPSTKLAMARQLQPPPPARPNRPQRYTATAEQVASVEGLSPAERLTKYREWRDQG